MEMANPLLESFGEPPKAHVANYSHPPPNLKGKGNPDLPSIGLFKPLASYCGSVCVLTFWYFRTSGNARLQSPANNGVFFSAGICKKDPIFSAARKIFAPSYFVTALLDLDSVHNARKLLNINLLSHFCQFLNSNLRYTVLMYTRGCQLGFSQKWPQFCK